MPRPILKEFEDATCNMSLPIMIALLSRIHRQLTEDGCLDDALEHVGTALTILMTEHEKIMSDAAMPMRPN